MSSDEDVMYESAVQAVLDQVQQRLRTALLKPPTVPWAEPKPDDVFQYQTLDRAVRQIRLVRIETTADGFAQCHIEHFNLTSAPPYRALSYMWGSESPIKLINVDGKAFSIKPNLADFLHIYKLRHMGEYIWIDQICIDQNSNQERNHQVSMMTAIYSQATEVLIWLHPLLWNAPPWGCTCGEEHECWDENDCARILGIVRNEYWCRMWIIQEVLLAKSIIIYYGTSVLSWFELSVLAQDSLLYAHFALSHLGNIKRHEYFAGDLPVSFFEATMFFKTSRCKDPRDKVYALQSLLEEKQRLVIDYDRSPWGVMLDASAILMREGIEQEKNVGELQQIFIALWSNIVDTRRTDATALLNSYILECIPKKGRPFLDDVDTKIAVFVHSLNELLVKCYTKKGL